MSLKMGAQGQARACFQPRHQICERGGRCHHNSEGFGDFDLIKVAKALGIVVTPATTLTDLVTRLEARTGLTLGTHLQAHLAARFGMGPLPEPWPLIVIEDA